MGRAVATHPGETAQAVGNLISLIPLPQAKVAGAVISGTGTVVRAVTEGGTPATTLKPGPFAGESTPASGPGRITGAQQAEVNRIGQESGCHSCGTLNLGTKSGNFVGDQRRVFWSIRSQDWSGVKIFN